VYPLPDLLREPEARRSLGRCRERRCQRDLARWTNAREGRRRQGEEKERVSALKSEESPLEGNPHHLASPLAFLWSPTRSFASSFNELSTNRGWHAFERDGGTTRSGFNLPACIRHSSDILACEIAIRFDIASRGTVRVSSTSSRKMWDSANSRIGKDLEISKLRILSFRLVWSFATS